MKLKYLTRGRQHQTSTLYYLFTSVLYCTLYTPLTSSTYQQFGIVYKRYYKQTGLNLNLEKRVLRTMNVLLRYIFSIPEYIFFLLLLFFLEKEAIWFL